MDIQALISRHENTADAVSDGVALVDRSAHCMFVDTAFCTALQADASSIIGHPFYSLFASETDRAEIRVAIVRSLNGECVSHPLFLRAANGGRIEYTATYVPALATAQQFDSIFVVLKNNVISAELHGRLLHYVRQQELLEAIDKATVGDRPLETVAALVVNHVMQLVPCKRICMLLTNQFLIEAAANQLPGGRAPHHGMPTNGTAPIGAEGFIVACSPESGKAALTDADYHLPLYVQGERMGELIIQLTPGAILDDDQSELLNKTVQRVDRALQHTLIGEKLRRYTVELEHAVAERTQEIERRRQAAQGLREILRFLNTNRPLGEVLSHVFKQAELLLGADAVAVFSPVELTDPDLGADSQIFVHSTLPAGLADKDFEAVRPAVVEAVGEGKAVVMVQPSDCPSSYRAQLVAPLHTERGVSGVVVFFFANETSLAAEAMELAVALGEQVMLATESERLQQRAQEAALLEERERLARELHDSVSQSIYSLTLFAEAGRRLASAGQIDRVQEYLTLLGDTAQQAMKQMRLMLYELRPAVLEQVGLIDALRQRIEAVEQRAGINARLEVFDHIRLPPAVEDCLYRICQEALNNALKHALANNVVVKVTAVDELVTLEIIDDGIGFAQAKADELHGPGLSHIREQALRLNADLVIQTAPNQGTIVRVSLVVPELNVVTTRHLATLESKQS